MLQGSKITRRPWKNLGAPPSMHRSIDPDDRAKVEAMRRTTNAAGGRVYLGCSNESAPASCTLTAALPETKTALPLPEADVQHDAALISPSDGGHTSSLEEHCCTTLAGTTVALKCCRSGGTRESIRRCYRPFGNTQPTTPKIGRCTNGRKLRTAVLVANLHARRVAFVHVAGDNRSIPMTLTPSPEQNDRCAVIGVCRGLSNRVKALAFEASVTVSARFLGVFGFRFSLHILGVRA